MCTAEKKKKFNSNILVTTEDFKVKFQIWYLHAQVYLVSNFSLTRLKKESCCHCHYGLGFRTLSNSAERVGFHIKGQKNFALSVILQDNSILSHLLLGSFSWS
jgi:hypothetical protein